MLDQKSRARTYAEPNTEPSVQSQECTKPRTASHISPKHETRATIPWALTYAFDRTCRNSSNGWSADKSRRSWRETVCYQSINLVSVHATRLKLRSSRCCRTSSCGWRQKGDVAQTIWHVSMRLIRSTIKSCFTALKVRLDWQGMHFRGWHRSWMAEHCRSSSTAWPPSSPRCRLAFRREKYSVHSCSCCTQRISQS